jgi:predicted  nucleic acid-binding Zn-ribbon protein
MLDIGNQIEKKAADIKQLEEEKEQLEQELADCLNDADNEVEELACNAEFVPQINAKQNAIDALGEEIEDLNDDMQDLQEQATGEATEAVEQGIENLTAALNCE